MTLRHLITLNAALLISTGLALWFGPVSLLPEGYGFPAGPQAGTAAGASDGGYDPQALGRLLGAGCFGAGLLLLAVHDVGGSRFGRRVTGALCAAHTAGFMAALTQQISIWESPWDGSRQGSSSPWRSGTERWRPCRRAPPRRDAPRWLLPTEARSRAGRRPGPPGPRGPRRRATAPGDQVCCDRPPSGRSAFELPVREGRVPCSGW